jgi:hypothetical protein
MLGGSEQKGKVIEERHERNIRGTQDVGLFFFFLVGLMFEHRASCLQNRHCTT